MPLLLLCGAGALLLQSWLESLEEMLCFGLPLFVVGAVACRVWTSMPADGADVPPFRPLTPMRRGLAIILVVLLLAGFGTIVWERFSDTGWVGWLDAVQMRHGGRYREKTSFVAAACDILIAYGAGMWAVLRIGRKP